MGGGKLIPQVLCESGEGLTCSGTGIEQANDPIASSDRQGTNDGVNNTGRCGIIQELGFTFET